MILAEADIPEGVDVSYSDGVLKVRGEKGELSQRMKDSSISIKVSKGNIRISSERDRRKKKALAFTWRALANNMIHGVTKGFEAKLKSVYVHFPMKLKSENNEIKVENLRGNRDHFSIPVPEGIDAEIKGADIIIRGIDKYAVGQFAALIEQKSKVRGRDKRIFQDGIYITQKPRAPEVAS